MSTYQHDAASTESNLLRRVLACLSNNAELIARARAEVTEELIDEPRERRDPPEQREQRWVRSAHEKQRRAMEMERRAIEMERRAMEVLSSSSLINHSNPKEGSYSLKLLILFLLLFLNINSFILTISTSLL